MRRWKEETKYTLVLDVVRFHGLKDRERARTEVTFYADSREKG